MLSNMLDMHLIILTTYTTYTRITPLNKEYDSEIHWVLLSDWPLLNHALTSTDIVEHCSYIIYSFLLVYYNICLIKFVSSF